MRHLFQMRMLIECHAAKMAASYMIEEDIIKLKRSIEIAKSSSPDEMVQANKQFHDLIVRECRNPIMIETVDKMQSIIYLFSRAVVLYKRPFLLDEHELICQAIADRDPEQASELMRTHLESDLEFALHFIN